MSNRPVVLTGLLLIMLLQTVMLSCARSGEAEKYFEKGRQLFDNEKLEESKIYFKKTIHLDAGYRQAWIMLAKTEYYLKDGKAALATLEKAVRKFPDYLEAKLWLGKVCYFTGDIPGAEKWLTAVIATDNGNTDARFILGEIFMKREEYDKALLNYVLLESNLDMIALAKLRKAEIYLKFGKYQDCLREVSFVLDNKKLFDTYVVEQANEVIAKIHLPEQKK